MQRLPFKLLSKRVGVDSRNWPAFKQYLKENKLTFSQWVRDQIKKVIK
jgi:hypothetical protein